MYRLVLFLLVLTSCKSRQVVPPEGTGAFRFAGSYVIPHGMKFWGTTVGGFSGIDFDSARNRYYILSDDGSKLHPARYYTAAMRFSERGIHDVELENVIQLNDSTGNAFANGTVDPEALRYRSRESLLYWTSEGERTLAPDSTRLSDPAIYVHHLDGQFKDKLPVPANMQMQYDEKGPRHNGSFEGLSFSPGGNSFFVSLEEPLYEDGPRAATGDSSAVVRIIRYNAITNLPAAQYLYPIDPVARIPQPAGEFKVNGVSELLAIGEDSLLVMERSFSTGFKGCVVRVYLVVLPKNSGASLPLLQKKLVIDMQVLPDTVYNVEGMCLGPRFANGSRSLIFVADDNFSTNDQTQFLLFEWDERKPYF